jgi:ferric-dicitrate binding protein FerR (iron transport regulator)
MDLNPFDALGADVAKGLDAAADPGPSERLRALLAGRAAGRTGPKRHDWARALPMVSAMALAAAAISLVVWRQVSTEPPSLAFAIGTKARAGVLREWISAPESIEVPLKFSDGSRVVLEPGSQARVVRLGVHAAEVVLESGKASVAVIPHASNQWRLRSGPFVVDVQGTRFDVAWNPGADAFEVAVYEGRVEIAGCGFGAGRPLAAGQRVRAACKQASAAISSLALEEPAPATPAHRVNPAPSETAPRTGAERTSGAPSPFDGKVADQPRPAPDASLDWVTLARKGFHQQAYSLIEARGFDRERRSRSPAELLLLGECARLTGHDREAHEAYEEVRRRAGGGGAAAQAAFELGRMDSARGSWRSAADRFDTYLREQPSGPLAVAARGRLLEALVALGDARAQATARTYLEQTPNGPHADAARGVLGHPTPAQPPR